MISAKLNVNNNLKVTGLENNSRTLLKGQTSEEQLECTHKWGC